MSDIQRFYSQPVSEPEPSTDRLEYVADLIAELELLAGGQPGCDTLRGLLTLAEREARRLSRASAA